MSNYNRGENMPTLPALVARPLHIVRVDQPPSPPEPMPAVSRGAGRYAPLAAPVDTPGAAYTPTCDAGRCDKLTVAVVRAVEGAWLSMCKKHAAEELRVL